MRIVRKKTYEQIKNYEEMKEDNSQLRITKGIYEKELKEQAVKIMELNKKVQELEKLRRQYAGKIGGLRKEINKLKEKQNENS